MTITADAVKQLRERTGAGMMECKKALVETKGDLDAAAELMRKQGLAKADKRAAKIAAEGVIVVEKSADGRTAAMAEVNCETDFVAREQEFRGFAQAVAQKALAAQPADLNALLAIKLDSGESVEERRRSLIAKIGENISVRRFALLSAKGQLGAYVHGTRIGALVALEGGDDALARDLAMHVAASNPRYLNVAAVPAEVVAQRGEGQAAGDRREDGRRAPAQGAGGNHAVGPAVREGPRHFDREAAQGRLGDRRRLRAFRSRLGHREEAGGLRRRGDGPGQGDGARQAD
jgi:elongation factor Ts